MNILTRWLASVAFMFLVIGSINPAVAQKTVTVTGIDGTTTDPHKISGAGDYQFINHIFEGLYGHDMDGKIVPKLALSHDVSPDGLVYTFKLRPNVKFHNGEPLTAEDIRFSWQRSNSPEIKNPRAAVVTKNIKDVESLDNQTVRITLNKPDASMLENLGEFFYIVSKPTIEKLGNDGFTKNPIGTGPLKFVSRKLGDSTVFAANESYWGTKVKYDRLVMKSISDPQTRVSMLRAGEVDAIANVPPQLAIQLKKDPNISVITRASYQNIFIVLNPRASHGQFADPKVRQALNMAIDRKTLIDKVMFGYATESTTLCNKEITGCDIDRKQYPYDPKKARALLESVNFDFTRTYNVFGLAPGRVAQSKEVAEAVFFYLNQIGVKTKLELLEYGTFLGRISAKDFESSDMFWMGWTDFNRDPMGRLPRNLHSNGTLSWQNDVALDQMIDKANSIVDPKEREEHLKKLFTHIFDNPPALFLWTTDEIYATRKNVKWEPRANVSWPEFTVLDKK